MEPIVSTNALLWRALMRRCPRCGRGAIMRSHFKMNTECPSCHVIYWKDPGESLGAIYVDYAFGFGLFFIAWAGLAILTNIPENVQIAILIAVALGSVLIFYPLSRSIWTLLVFVSGGIERPRMRAIGGGRRS